MKTLPWKDDSFLSRQGTLIPWDKAEHLALAAILTWFLMGIGNVWEFAGAAALLRPPIWATVIPRLIGIEWEIKDGIRPYDKAGHIQGFSFKDLIANETGILIAVLLWSVI